MSNTNKPALVSHLGRKHLNVVPMLLILSLGFVLGMTSNANFLKFYLPFLTTLPFPMPSPPLPTSLPPPTPLPPPPQAPPMPSPQTPQMGLMGFLAPSGVMHNMTDEELFWRASMVPQISRKPDHRVPKVAFLFLATGDLSLRPLWEKFFMGHDGLYSIYMHTSPSYTGSPPKDSVFYGRMIPSQITRWGDITLVEAERRLLANALLDLGNERFVLLSDSSIPVYDFPTVHAHLTGSNTSFVDSFVNHDSEVRYNPFFASRCNITLEQWRKGVDWFEMDRALAIKVISDDAYFPSFREYCARRRYCLMDEHYIATLLSVLGWSRNANRTLTHEDWRRGGSHPRTHQRRDVTEELIKDIRGGAGKNCTYNGRPAGICYLFARKFAPDALDPLLTLAPKLMGFG
ncbi:glycosyltransferase BC10-like [Phragmites australis]|uniref:glycosyltransferase BC10-like n=1 Tax=Phragmites australis TaxID=29695 RepID=UPI002D77FA0F|nr:glycosyltransferase BC10-like [Phragmites australis]